MEQVTVAREGYRVELRVERRDLEPGIDLPESAEREVLTAWLFDQVRAEPVEVFGAVYFDRWDRPVGYTMPYRGTTTQVGPEIRHLLIKAWSCQATSMIVFHNHPGGAAYPSRADEEWTEGLLALAAPLGIEVRDHLILAEEPHWCSMVRTGSVRGLGHPAAAVWPLGRAVEWLRRLQRPAPESRRKARPRYRDPETGETWAGRGSMAGWLRRRIEEGHSLEEYRVEPEATQGDEEGFVGRLD
ncbi:MAG: JAB domain-containing protein [Acidobacteriota bacterium]